MRYMKRQASGKELREMFVVNYRRCVWRKGRRKKDASQNITHSNQKHCLARLRGNFISSAFTEGTSAKISI